MEETNRQRKIAGVLQKDLVDVLQKAAQDGMKGVLISVSKDVLLDIIDTNGTTLLYNTIKLNKIEILKLLIESSNNTIGINIIDKKDIRGRTPLHYCVIFNNIDAFHLILDNNGDPYIPNKDGLNIFFYCLVRG